MTDGLHVCVLLLFRYERLRINFSHLKLLEESQAAVDMGLEDVFVTVREVTLHCSEVQCSAVNYSEVQYSALRVRVKLTWCLHYKLSSLLSYIHRILTRRWATA